MNVKQDLPEIPSLMDRVRDGVMCSLAQKDIDRWAKHCANSRRKPN